MANFEDFFGFGVQIKRTEDMDIEDVAKLHILPFLSAKSLVRFRAVSKGWNKWIRRSFLAHKQTLFFRETSGFFCETGDYSPIFISLNPSFYGIPSPPLAFMPPLVTVRSSCQGLLLCQAYFGDYVYYVCNPATKQRKLIRKPNCCHGADPAIVVAFDPGELNFTEDFYLICPLPEQNPSRLGFEIYSSSEDSWTESAVVCSELGCPTLRSGGFYMNGIAYWETSCGNVLAFDHQNKFCGVQNLPHGCASKGVLTQLRGELCYVHAINCTEGAYLVDLYTGMGFSVKHTIELDVGLLGDEIQPCRALPIANNDTLMLVIGHAVCSYRLTDQKFDVISKDVTNGLEATYVPYVNSLVAVGPN